MLSLSASLIAPTVIGRGLFHPSVLAVEEVRLLLAETSGTVGLMLRLIYGGGLRISDALRLRVQDLDFKNDLLFVRSGKGDKDRTTILPERLYEELQVHLEKVRGLHEGDLAKGFGEVYLPDALAHKYPNAPREWKWQYVFPAKNLSVDPRSGKTRRHHLSDKVLQTAMHQAVRSAGISATRILVSRGVFPLLSRTDWPNCPLIRFVPMKSNE